MKSKSWKIVLMMFCMLTTFTLAYADITIDTRRLIDAGRVIEVSWDSINMLKFPDDIKDIKTTKKINTSIQGNIALVSLGQPVMTEIYVMTANGKVYSLILKPKQNAMAFNYEFVDQDVMAEKTIQQETANPFEVTVRDIVFQAKQNGKISGYQPKSFRDLIFRKGNLFIEKTSEHIGMHMTVEVWNIVNNGPTPIKLKEQDFNEDGVIAVMFDEQAPLISGGNSLMYIVRKKM